MDHSEVSAADAEGVAGTSLSSTSGVATGLLQVTFDASLGFNELVVSRWSRRRVQRELPGR
jgi:hypothetical protein